MIDTSVFFKNPFSSPDVSDEELKSYAEEHLKQLNEVNKNGQFSTMISDTVDAFNSYYGSNNGKAKSDTGGSGDEIKQKIFSEFVKTVRLKEKTIRYLSDEISPIIYREFFPAGMDEYTHASLADAERLFTRVIRASGNHTKELGQKFADQMNELKSRYSKAKASGATQNSGSNNNGTVLQKDRTVLERQLIKNLLTFALVYVNEPDDEDIGFFSKTFSRPSSANSQKSDGKSPSKKHEIGA